MARAIDAETRVVFIANPNNPTGTLLAAGEIEAFLRAVPPQVVVVIDEAYNEYLPGGRSATTASPGSARHRNLIVTRTFSKAYGLAGLRVGFALCDAHDGGPPEPRAPAVQRQQPRARRCGRRAGRRRRSCAGATS